jgi:hypothetical protein
MMTTPPRTPTFWPPLVSLWDVWRCRMQSVIRVCPLEWIPCKTGEIRSSYFTIK